MPMPYKEYQWRPNDNSSITNHRYDLEASKWLKAVKSEEIRTHRSGAASDIKTVGALASLPFLVIMWIFFLFIGLIRWIFNYNIKLLPGDEPSGKINKDPYAAYRVDVDRFKREHAERQSKKSTQAEMEDMANYIHSLNYN